MYTRTNPYLSRLKERFLLTGAASTKKTYHLSLDIAGSNLAFRPGDSVAVLPSNDAALVDRILGKLGAQGDEEFADARSGRSTTLRDYLLHKANISKVSSACFKLLCKESGLLLPERKAELAEYLQAHTLLDLLERHPYPTAPSSLSAALLPLMPRFYSIASSQKVFPDEIHLTVAHVSYIQNGQARFGVGTHFLCDSAQLYETPVPIYIQPSHHFALPPDPDASIILIGPGTGVAPFRAFLQERLAAQAQGRNWLFFGERNRASDFYYESFWTDLEAQNRLRLDLAFSRDQAEKIYVQHRMLEHKKTLWNWLQTGSYLYVCGDAEQMAKDVDAALHQIAQEEGRMTEEESRRYIKALRAEKRYLLDVY